MQKSHFQSELEECEDEEERRLLEWRIRRQEEEIERLKQELETTATDDDSDRDAEEGSVNLIKYGRHDLVWMGKVYTYNIDVWAIIGSFVHLLLQSP